MRQSISIFKSLLALLATSNIVHGLQSAVYSSASEVQARGRTFIISNDDKTNLTIWVEGQIGADKTTIPPGKVLAIIDVPEKTQGALRGIRSGDRANTVTKFEFSLGGPTGDVINLSCGICPFLPSAEVIASLTKKLVDGYNVRIAVEFDGSNRQSMETYVPESAIAELCPSSNLIQVGDHVSCMSDCRAAEQSGGNSHKYCCEGPYRAHGSCEQSNQHLAAYVGNSAYLWPHDDGKMQTCRLGKVTRFFVGGNMGGVSYAVPDSPVRIEEEPIPEPEPVVEGLEPVIEVVEIGEPINEPAAIDEPVLPDFENLPSSDKEEDVPAPAPTKSTPTVVGKSSVKLQKIKI